MQDTRDPLNLIVCGTGGQGNVLLSRFLARMMAKKDYQITIGETFGASQRGGAVMSHVRLSRAATYGALIPEGKAHLIIGLEPMETIRVLGIYGNPEVAVVSNVYPVNPIKTITGENSYPDIEEMKRVIQEMSARCWFLNATRISIDMGNPVLANMVMIGALTRTNELNLTRPEVDEMIHETFPGKAAGVNIEAASLGFQGVEAL